MEQFQVGSTDDRERLDRLVARHAGVSRRVARIWIAQGRVKVAGKIVKILSRQVRAGAQILVALPERAETQPEAEPAHLVRILHLDRWVVAVDKPPGLLSETGRVGSPSLETVVPRLLEEAGERKREVRLAHRLDAGTSGVVILARTPTAARKLGDAFAQGGAHKTYLALCAGELTGARRVDAPIGRARGVRHEVNDEGKPASTLISPVATTSRASLAQAEPRTGRTHQIRVHLAHIGHPILGDGLYGGPRYDEDVPPEPIGRPMLHASRLVVPHPKTGEPLELGAETPADFRALAERLGLWREGA